MSKHCAFYQFKKILKLNIHRGKIRNEKKKPEVNTYNFIFILNALY